MSHDLRNPLSVAAGRLELARESGESEDFEAVAKALDRMENLIEDLLELAISGAQAPNLQRVRLTDVVERSQQHLASAESAGVDVSELELYADRNQLELLVGNLISNAMEHGGAGVALTIGELSDGWYIEDNGPGVPLELRDQVFDSGFTTKPDGTGFGLDVVKQVVDAHDWSIQLTESHSGGARFEITEVKTVV